MQPGLAAVATEVGGHRRTKDEMIVRYDASIGNRESSHTSPCVTGEAEHQHAGKRQIRALRRPSVKVLRSGQRFDGRDHHYALHRVGELRVERDECIGLERSQCDVLGVERVRPPELVGDLPCDVLKDTVSERNSRRRAGGRCRGWPVGDVGSAVLACAGRRSRCLLRGQD